jgi:hypothetical protein
MTMRVFKKSLLKNYKIMNVFDDFDDLNLDNLTKSDSLFFCRRAEAKRTDDYLNIEYFLTTVLSVPSLMQNALVFEIIQWRGIVL